MGWAFEKQGVTTTGSRELKSYHFLPFSNIVDLKVIERELSRLRDDSGGICSLVFKGDYYVSSY